LTLQKSLFKLYLKSKGSRMRKIQVLKTSLLFLIVTQMAACGGGGSGSAASAPAPAPAPVPAPTPAPQGTLATACAASTDGLALVGDTSIAVGKPAGVSVLGCVNSPLEVKWTQTAGSPVAVYADRMQAMSFEPTLAGTYTFKADVIDAQGAAQSRSISVNAVAAPTASYVGARLDHAVYGGSDVSLRAWPANFTGGVTFAWQQIEGPAVTWQPSAGDASLAQFVAPNVAKDDLFRFRVTASFANGNTDTDEVSIVVQQQKNLAPVSNTALFDNIKVSPVHAYKPAGKYAGILTSCVYDTKLFYATSANTNVCTFAKLPLIGQEAAGQVPTVEQIMDHVVVSHDWMGANFENFLRTQDNSGDLRRLLGGVTAIVIGSHVRPSFYYVGTGAIYLDAENLWLNASERDVINEAPDFRASFGAALQYVMPWRYVQNNNYVRFRFPNTSRLTRSVSYLTYELGDLLYHELAHANDFIPTSARAGLSLQSSPLSNFEIVSAPGSDTLTNVYPLFSQEMAGLGQVNFRGVTATSLQKSYTPAAVAGFFSADRASDEYAYSSTREDFAMLHEEFMMLYRHGVQRDVAVTPPITATTTASNLIVTWGQRSRVTEPTIKPRLKTVLQQISPWIDVNAVDTLGAPIAMRAGQSWTSNLVLPGPIAGSGFSSAEGVRFVNNEELKDIQQRMDSRRQAHQISEKFAIKFLKQK
jgi:hypothetical protein